jgi:hypothetical protein
LVTAAVGERWMAMTPRHWRDGHSVMHGEPSPAFCGSHTDETVTSRHTGSRTPEGQTVGAWGEQPGPAQAGFPPCEELAGDKGPGQSCLRAASVPRTTVERHPGGCALGPATR